MGSLKAASDLGLASISMPAISTGIYNFPKPRAARIILSAVRSYFTQNPEVSLAVVRIVLYDQDTLMAFLTAVGAEQELY
jgi:putative ATPase